MSASAPRRPSATTATASHTIWCHGSANGRSVRSRSTTSSGCAPRYCATSPRGRLKSCSCCCSGSSDSRRAAARTPAPHAERITVKRRPEFAVLSPTEVQAVARATTTEQDAALILVAAFTGLRLGELRALRWRDVDFANRLVHVRRSHYGKASAVEGPPKSGLARSVPLIDQAARALDGLSRRERSPSPADRVFCAPAGETLNDGAIRGALYDALKAAHVDRDRGTGQLFRFHDLRHTFGTLAVQAFPLSDVKAYMGHADIATTMLYVHHQPQHAAADRLGQLVNDSERVPAGTQLSESEVI